MTRHQIYQHSQKRIKREQLLSGLGTAEIWIPSISRKGMYYSSSTWICHYIIDHHYLPPDEYIESVLALSELEEINADIIAFDLKLKYHSLQNKKDVARDFSDHMHKVLERRIESN